MRTNDRLRFIAVALVSALVLSACGGAAEQTTSGEAAAEPAGGAAGDETLNIAFFADMSTADPDIFYDIEGLAVMLSAYEGLLRYAPGTTDLEGALAESWELSDDGLTYTFAIREGVSFADGTPLDSAAIQASFERRTAVDQGPAYMLADVDSYETPDPGTFVINLTQPVSAFPHYLASAWSPKAISPTVLEEQGGNDNAQAYLAEHSAGTGPFQIETFSRGTGYTLTRNDDYWGGAPHFAAVDVAITPDVSAQLLAVERGDLDAILHGFPLANLESVSGNSDLRVEEFPSLGTTSLYLNEHKPALADAETREAIIRAIDVPSLVQEVYGETAQVPDSAYPSGLLEPSLAPLELAADQAAAQALADDQSSIDIVYTPDSSGVQRRLADIVRQRLATVGVNASPRQVQLGDVFGYREDVENAADIYVSTPAPDGAHPDTWGRIVWYTEGALNFFNYTNPAVDEALDRGLREPDQDVAAEAYGEAGQLASEDWTVVPVAYINDVVVARSDLSGMEHVPAYPWTVDLGALGRDG